MQKQNSSAAFMAQVSENSKKSLGKTLAGTMLFLVMVLQLLFPQALVLAASSSVQAYGMDTVAGYSTILNTSQTSSPLMGVTFRVKKPSGDTIELPAATDKNGVAKVDLSDYHTRTAGQYFVSVVANGIESDAKSFSVYADKVSPDQSAITVPSTLVTADGKDQATLQVKVVDQYQNPLAGHQITLTSNRPQDKIVASVPNGLSDKNGAINFSVSSTATGVATFTGIDTTANVVISEQAQIAFITSDHSLANSGGDFGSFINVAQAASGSLSHFEITNLPASIQAGQNVSFTVNALDDSNQVVQNYMGKIHFSAEGNNSNNATLPEDYTFTASDLGSHQFSLGLSFTSNGTYKITATDLNNPLIKGSKDVVVGNGGGQSQQQQQPGGALKPTIETPAAGTYSQKIQTISGSAPAGYTVKVFDNDQGVGSVQVNNSGKYSYQTGALSDGVHKIYVTTLDQSQTVQGTSDTVQFSIDSTAPTVDDLSLQPNSGIQSGQVITVDVASEENLSQAAAVFNGDIIQLNANIDNPGHYIGSVQAPSNAGVYPIDIILVDQLGNEGSYKAKAQITVGNAVTQQQTEQITQQSEQATEQQTQQTQEPMVNPPPSKVSRLLSYAGDKKVTLVWDPATDDTAIKHYRVYFGTNAATLDQYADTKDASTTWYIPNLQNGKTYYFALTAFDDQGTESSERSQVISGIPFALETSTLPKPATSLQNSAKDDTLHGAFDQAVPPRNPGSGPELIWVFSGAGFLGTVWQQLKKKRKTKITQ